MTRAAFVAFAVLALCVLLSYEVATDARESLVQYAAKRDTVARVYQDVDSALWRFVLAHERTLDSLRAEERRTRRLVRANSEELEQVNRALEAQARMLRRTR